MAAVKRGVKMRLFHANLPTMVTAGATVSWPSNWLPYCSTWFLVNSRLKLKSGWLSMESPRSKSATSAGGGGGGSAGGGASFILLLSPRITGSVQGQSYNEGFVTLIDRCRDINGITQRDVVERNRFASRNLGRKRYEKSNWNYHYYLWKFALLHIYFERQCEIQFV